jgi:glycosyltransferase involved in cell wall biosynthesis
MTRNIAIRKSQGEFILILDSDTVILPEVLDTLLQTKKKCLELAL